MAQLVQQNPSWVSLLLDIAFDVDDPISSRACWVLEFMVKEHLPFIFPYVDRFVEKLGLVHLDPSVRPMAKICEYLITSYFLKSSTHTRNVLTSSHLEKIAAACFDWLITDQKVAAKAYSMTCLSLLGQKFEWIHPELKMVLEQNYALGSAAYKARARMVLAKLKSL